MYKYKYKYADIVIDVSYKIEKPATVEAVRRSQKVGGVASMVSSILHITEDRAYATGVSIGIGSSNRTQDTGQHKTQEQATGPTWSSLQGLL